MKLQKITLSSVLRYSLIGILSVCLVVYVRSCLAKYLLGLESISVEEVPTSGFYFPAVEVCRRVPSNISVLHMDSLVPNVTVEHVFADDHGGIRCS